MDWPVKVDLASSALSAPAAEFAGVEFYPEFSKKAAILCWHILKNHPLLDGNKRAAYLCLVEFAERNGYTWRSELEDEDEVVEMINGAADNSVSPAEFHEWVHSRLLPPSEREAGGSGS